MDEISKIVGGNWKGLLIHLGIPSATVEAFPQDNLEKSWSTCRDGLVFWREGNIPCKPATWSVLLEAVEKGAEMKDYADSKRSTLLSQSGLFS